MSAPDTDLVNCIRTIDEARAALAAQADEIARLKAEALAVDAEQTRIATNWLTQLSAALERAGKAEADAEANRRDAERYRHLSEDEYMTVRTYDGNGCQLYLDDKAEMDKAIDAALGNAEQSLECVDVGNTWSDYRCRNCGAKFTVQMEDEVKHVCRTEQGKGR